ncbi:VIT1/CCC1 transporter family protein [Lacticaseibacillus saniviri]|uniref:Integral membrane protein n=1 Tax=Lacticaseibacillus saniviri JCM 17471 = DSM 24301 TaxID=1293598 RepID=A0A0R2MRH9_9LACO|nr:integral membrane protein [Lacticaseibacillus saniviri JCM 17471 = DSM 24301]
MTMEQTTKAKPAATLAEKANTLRAGVLGANDGILTVVGVLFSVAAATTNPFTIFIAGLADLLACAFSMASGEYASVSSQKDTEQAVVDQEAVLLETDHETERQIAIDYYKERGVTTETATQIADDLLQKNALATMIRIKYSLELGHYMNPWSAAWSSMFSAALGGIFPLMAMTLLPVNLQWPGTIVAVTAAVTITGFMSAKLGDGLVKRAMIRNVVIGLITMAIHYGIGQIL